MRDWVGAATTATAVTAAATVTTSAVTPTTAAAVVTSIVTTADCYSYGCSGVTCLFDCSGNKIVQEVCSDAPKSALLRQAVEARRLLHRLCAALGGLQIKQGRRH